MTDSSETLLERSLNILADLVSFDTTSRRTNLELIAYTEALLAQHGIKTRRIANSDGSKANLLATIGPHVEGGVVLSGHTDVVPVDGQDWTSNPFRLIERDDLLIARGCADMKGFLALALAVVPDLASSALKRPVHLAFSYDEELGCLGAPDMIAEMVRDLPMPSVVVVGEPTEMQVVAGHKGVTVYRVVVHGREAHSSQTHLGVSANAAAVRLLGRLVAIADDLELHEDAASPFYPAHPTLTIGTIQGGTASNILARECVFHFDLRCPPGFEADVVLAPFFAEAEALDKALKARAPEAGVQVDLCAYTPPLSPQRDDRAEQFVRTLAGDNGPTRAVSYGTEAGQFQRAGYSTLICGPGSIAQAHKPDEFISRAQLQRGANFMLRLRDAMTLP